MRDQQADSREEILPVTIPIFRCCSLPALGLLLFGLRKMTGRRPDSPTKAEHIPASNQTLLASLTDPRRASFWPRYSIQSIAMELTSAPAILQTYHSFEK